MPNYTENYELIKPLPTDLYDIEVQNQNMDKVDKALKDMVNLIYPVGSIYMSVNSTSPETLFGGTWEQIQGRFLLGASSTYAAGSTGGKATHTLTVDEMPSHTHKLDGYEGDGATTGWSVSRAKQTYSALSGIKSTGGGKAHNNMPPYLSVYIWNRTA